jgi:predicted PurR-regulated permease PerM
VLFAIIVGGSLFGIAGMLFGVPVFAVVYTIVRRTVNRRLREKNIETV